MKLPRDESGYVLVLRKPQVVLIGEADEKQEKPHLTLKPVQTPAKTSCSVPHCCFPCGWCGESILLPNF